MTVSGPAVEAVRSGDRRALAKAITLLESHRPDHTAAGRALLEDLMPHTGGAARVGITGPPGVGKSTFIEALGVQLIESGLKVAVLAVDPSSPITGGSILGDKTRMECLAQSDRAFIRPSPAGGTLGGVAHRTREVILLCEAAGFDVILVETVGIGQSEVAVRSMVDFFLVLMLAGAGDELQGIKRGILEMADMIAINKADGDNIAAARIAQREYSSAVRLMRLGDGGWRAPVLSVSSLENTGIDELWTKIDEHRKSFTDSGLLEERRNSQLRRWMWSMVDAKVLDALRKHPGVSKLADGLERDVLAGKITPTLGARTLLEAFGIKS